MELMDWTERSTEQLVRNITVKELSKIEIYSTFYYTTHMSVALENLYFEFSVQACLLVFSSPISFLLLVSPILFVRLLPAPQ